MSKEKQSIERCKKCRLFKECEDWEAQEGKWGLCLDFKPIKHTNDEATQPGKNITAIKFSEIKQLLKEHGLKEALIELIQIDVNGNKTKIHTTDVKLSLPNDMWGKLNPKIQIFFREGWKIV